MITSNEVQQQLQKYFGNIGAVTALPADPDFPNDLPRFEVEITGGKLGAGFLKAVELKTGYQAEFVLKRGSPREDVIHLAVPAVTIVEPPLDTQDTKRWPRVDPQETVEVAPADVSAEASVNQPSLTEISEAEREVQSEAKTFNPFRSPADATTAADPRDLRIDDLQTCVNLLQGLLDEREQTIKAYRLVNQAQSQMLREEIVLPEAKPPTRVEVKTLMHQPAYADADRELATALSEGWQMLHAAVYVNPADEMTWRTVTLVREATAPAQPQPEKTATAPNGVMERGARNGVFPPMQRPNKGIIDHHPLPTVTQTFVERFPMGAEMAAIGVEAWKAQQNQAQLDAAMTEFRASLADVPDFKPLPTLLKAGEPS